ncbi:ABC transporter permease [Nocardiopsis potens]|uniref:ABC transporter permease n=1 Tax=Nocardiopsis potens TaxID=1246458 RepID=UPI00035CCB18|nr:ABC transporter permease [Nocardiopsis potens]
MAAQSVRPVRGEFARAAAMEWTRLASLRTTWWCVGVGAAAMVVFAVLMGVSTADRIADDPASASEFSYVRLTSQGVFYLLQFVVLTLAALIATGEYGNGGSAAALLAVPRRGRLLAARAAVTAGFAFAAGAAVTAIGIGALRLVLGAGVPLDPGYAVRTVLGAGVCMALFAAMAVGLGTALRGTAATIGAGLLLLLGIPMVLQLSQAEWLSDLAAAFPGFAGVELYASGDAGFYTAPHDGPVNAFTVLGWAAAALIIGYAELRSRDA